MSVFTFEEWLPDQPDLGNPGTIVAKNCLPGLRGFRPFPAASVVSTALDARPLGAISAIDSSGGVHSYAGNATKLYSLAAATWSDVSIAGGYTNTAIHWDFASFGEVIIATNYIDDPQEFNMDTAALFSVLTTDFKAKYVAVVRDFVVFGYLNTSGTINTNRVRWSSITDYTDYTVSASTQADFQDTPNGGSVQRIFGGEYGVVFFQNSIMRMSYVGSPVIFQFDDIAPENGLYAPGAAAQDGDNIYFLDADGFYVLKAGQAVQAIGNEKVDAWFWSMLDGTQKDRISCAVDHENKVAMWSFPALGNAGGKPDTILCFDIETGRWSYAMQDNDMIYSGLSVGFTLEDLDSLPGDLDDINISLDSRIFFAGNKAIGLFDSFTLHVLAGSPLTAVFETKEQQLFQGGRALITEAWPLVDGGTTTVEIGTRDRQQDNVVWSSSATVNAVGFAPTRSEGRYVRARLTCSGLWDEAQAVDLIEKPTGGR